MQRKISYNMKILMNFLCSYKNIDLNISKLQHLASFIYFISYICGPVIQSWVTFLIYVCNLSLKFA